MHTSILRSTEGFLRLFGNSFLHCCVTSTFVVFYIILYNTTEVNLVENKNIADEQSFMDPMGENGEELKSENDQLATRTDHMSDEKIKDGNTKYILFWTKFYAWSSMLSKVLPEWEVESDLSFLGCPSSRCQLTANRTLLPNVEMFDAIVFHQFNFEWEDLPSARSSKQFYVFFTLEAAAHRQGGLRNRIEQLNKIPGFFNLTMTYRQDSDVPAPYGQFEGREEHQPPSGLQLEEYIRKFGRDNQHLAEKKTESQGLTIAQYVSNCETAVGRENLVDMIDYLTPVDIYGNCGDFYCSQLEEVNCLNLLGEKYKFYLSFENAMCKDYITEKFFMVLNQNVIPVVFTGANMSSVAPPHAYINVADFPTIQELVAYLKRVASNDSLFASYFWWKDFYTVSHYNIHDRKDTHLQARYWCGLCNLLWSQDGKESRSVMDLYDWWVNQANCSTLKIGVPPGSRPAKFHFRERKISLANNSSQKSQH